MVKLRNKILKPFLIVIISIPVAIMILFNMSLSHYANLQAKEDLRFVAENISSSIRDDNFMRIFPFLRSQYGSSTVEIVVYNKQGNTAFFLEEMNSFVTNDVANSAYQVLKQLPLGDIGSFAIAGDDYYIIEVEYAGRGLYDKVAYISKGLLLDDFVTTINLLLLLISILVTILAIFISHRVARSIAKPIEEITHSIESVKAHELLTTPTKSDSIELYKLAVEFNAMNQRIYRAHSSQKAFLHNASHELRTPLMNIQGYADGIEMGIFTDTKETAHLISEQSKRLTQTVDSLLTLARAENFDKETKLLHINVSDYLREMLTTFYGQAKRQNIFIIEDIPNDMYAHANEELLLGSVGNILSNALRYAKTTINVSLNQENQTLVITIKDDGNGIEDSSTIFDRFSKGADGQFGLGLSIAKTSIDMMNGSINVFNDQGAVFEIELLRDVDAKNI